MNRICNDNPLYYYVLNSRKILIATEVISITIGILLILNFIIRIKKNKINHTLRKDLKKTIISLLILFIIPFSLNIFANYIVNHTDYSKCLEDEELNTIEDSPITIPEYVSPKKDDKKSPSQEIITIDENNNEKIEVVEENTDTLEETIYKENNFYFLNVGAGTEAFIIEDDGKFGLIDTSYNSKASFILKQLEILGAEKLDFLIITHAHLDHIGGYEKILSKIPIDTLYIKIPGNVNSDYIETYHNMVNKAEEKGTTICDVQEKLCQNFMLGNINIQVYNTNFITAKGTSGLDRSRIENANSITVVAEINNRRIYYASDIGDYFDKNIETQVAKEVGDVDVYKLSHHGYVSFNNGLEALSYLTPEYGIVTSNKELTRTSINRLKNTSPNYTKTYYTTKGTISLHIAMDGTLEFTQ